MNQPTDEPTCHNLPFSVAAEGAGKKEAVWKNSKLIYYTEELALSSLLLLLFKKTYIRHGKNADFQHVGN